LELPDFKAQLTRTSEHVAVDVRGLTVWFERSVGAVSAGAISYPMDLGHATAVVAALDVNRNIEVNENKDGDVVVQTTAPQPAPSTTDARGSGQTSGDTQATQPKNGGQNVRPPTTRDNGSAASTGTSSKPPGTSAPALPGTDSTVAQPPGDITEPVDGVDPVSPPINPDETALPSPGEIADTLGLRGANSVSRAFGAFLGLGLILPLARFVIRRLG
jgi:hypothetical protein